MNIGIAGLALVAVAAAGCATTGGSGGDRASTTTTTSVELYAARVSEKPACSLDLPESIHFESNKETLAPMGDVDVQRWAACLEHPEMRHATVVLTGGEEPRADAEEGRFVRRATLLKSELVRRGVDPARILIAAPNAAREGGRIGASSDVRVEVTHATTLRALR